MELLIQFWGFLFLRAQASYVPESHGTEAELSALFQKTEPAFFLCLVSLRTGSHWRHTGKRGWASGARIGTHRKAIPKSLLVFQVTAYQYLGYLRNYLCIVAISCFSKRGRFFF